MQAAGMKVAILGAGGLTGQFLVGALSEKGIDVRAVVRRPEYAQRFTAGTDVAVADFDDVEAIAQAVRGCAAVYLIPPSFNPAEERFAANILAAMKRAGVERFVYHSVLHSPTPGMPHHMRKSQVELLVRESDRVWTILQPAMYVQTVLSFYADDGLSLQPPFDLDRPFNVIAPVDLVGSIVRVLTDPATAYGTYELAGSERLSMRQMAEELSTEFRRPVSVELSEMEAIVDARARKRGWSVPQQAEYRAMLSYYGQHGLPGSGLTLQMLLGRAATPFAQAARALRGN